ncbi:MAG: hypothetical protein A2295_02300 [Candidatus Jacksonbacteria bacterium RIFOXYB2_FULL_44_15]|nr:MAG: hypothetical protein UW45_C0005G0020 [Parcubacteria group bacterium GW2011_GWC2_44_22]OGY76460.1 MAG: hypothetical protein A2295_02300 [Candidatus Jacksonbacteria bacterium RIFOXYB2_FULL_44_15]OGY76831.1 MAG: hypothetical protein A2240_04635 [Candidatus Jacksonbacteria bacterium RIFOXYA2_FULL_43_12]OGY82190.1 MAG: hypothetical protein A2550_05805 [Candidatus Jacksonbacteria bacterium RIFOXYD2_FULL_43_21]
MLKKILSWQLLSPILTTAGLLFRPLQIILKQDILIMINEGNRDTLGLFLVYAHLKYGYKLKIKVHSMMFLQRFWVLLYRPTIITSINIDCPEGIKIYEFLHDLGCYRLMIPTEHAMYNTIQYLITQFNIQGLIDNILVANEKMKELFINEKKSPADQIHVIGYPTFDWSVPPLNTFFEPRKTFFQKHRVPLDRKVILLASSFSVADAIDDNNKKYQFAPIPEAELIKLIETTQKLRKLTIDCFTELLTKHPNWQLFIRKHPFEKPDLYFQAWANHWQVCQVHYEEIHDVLANCDVFVHWRSTSSLQAWGFGKPTILINFNECPNSLQENELESFHLGNYLCQHLAELEPILATILNGQPLPATQIEHRKRCQQKFFPNMDGHAAETAAQLIHKLFRQEQRRKIKFSTKPLDTLHLLRGFGLWFVYKINFQLARLLKCQPNNFRSSLIKISSAYDGFALEFHQLRLEKKISKHLRKIYDATN